MSLLLQEMYAQAGSQFRDELQRHNLPSSLVALTFIFNMLYSWMSVFHFCNLDIEDPLTFSYQLLWDFNFLFSWNHNDFRWKLLMPDLREFNQKFNLQMVLLVVILLGKSSLWVLIPKKVVQRLKVHQGRALFLEVRIFIVFGLQNIYFVI